MKDFKNWRILNKLLFISLFPLSVAIILTNAGHFIGMYELQKDAIATERTVYSLWRQYNRYISEIREFSVNPNTETVSELVSLNLQISDSLNIYEKLSRANEAATPELLAKIKQISNELVLIQSEMNTSDQNEIHEKIEAVEDKIDTFFSESSETIAKEMHKEILGLRLLMIAATIISVFIGIFLSFRLAKLIQLPIDMLIKSSNRLGSGDYDERVPLNSKDEFGQLGYTFNKMAADLQKALLDHARGINERLKAEDEKSRLLLKIEESQRLESLGTFAGGIAHDFNNIIMAIIGYSELGLEKVSPESRVHDNLIEINKAGHRASELTQQILNFSRKSEAKVTPCNVRLVIEEIAKLIRAVIPATIEVQINIAEESGEAVVMADQIQLHQIFMNLCTNAFHAMRDSGGTLRISTSLENFDPDSTLRKELSLESRSYLNVEISDTGHGMSNEILSRIFEPYFTTKFMGDGAGMGLAVVYGIVKSHRGAIRASSKIDEGTIFNMFLPIVRVPQVSSDDHSYKLEVKGNNESILLVDDEPSLVDMISEMLAGSNYKVTASTSSEDALKIFQKQPDSFDLVITDMTMPKMTGAELARKILSIKPDMDIILCTGYSEEINKQKAMQMGIKGYLSKPLSGNTLLQKIRSIIDKNDA